MTDVREELRRAAGSAPLPSDAFDGMLRRRERRQRNRRIGSAFVALSVVVAAVVAVLSLRSLSPAQGGRPGDSRLPGPHANAANPGSTRTVAGPGDHYYLKTVESYVCSDRGDVAYTLSETWWAPNDGSGRVRSATVCDKRTADTPPSPGDSDGWQTSDERVTFPAAAELPTDADELERVLRERSAPGGASPQPQVSSAGGDPATAGIWRAVRDLLRRTDSTPALRLALVRVANSLSGADVEVDVVDPLGRQASVTEFRSEGFLNLLYYDVAAGFPLAMETRTLDRGRVVDVWAIEAMGVVGSTDDTIRGEESIVPAPVHPLEPTQA